MPAIVADVPVTGLLVVELGRRLVADVQVRHLVDRVERKEPVRRPEHRGIEAAEVLRRLGDEVEEGGADPDAGADGDDQPDVADRPQGEPATRHGRGEGTERDEEGCAHVEMILGLNLRRRTA